MSDIPRSSSYEDGILVYRDNNNVPMSIVIEIADLDERGKHGGRMYIHFKDKLNVRLAQRNVTHYASADGTRVSGLPHHYHGIAINIIVQKLKQSLREFVGRRVDPTVDKEINRVVERDVDAAIDEVIDALDPEVRPNSRAGIREKPRPRGPVVGSIDDFRAALQCKSDEED